MRSLFPILLLLALCPRPASAQGEFSGERATVILRDLVLGIGPRPMGSPAEQRALEYARASFAASGCDTSYVLPMSASLRSNTSSGVAVGVKRGATGRIIVIGGHIDSAGPEIPGADDDGSGSAVVMEAARVLGSRSTQSTIVFCCFGGEEEGLQGSRYFVDNFPALDSVVLMLQVDMANGLEIIDIDPDTHGESAPAWLVRAAVEEFAALGYSGLRYPTHFFSLNYALPEGSGSDHEAFLRKGIPAVDFSTDVSKPIHTPRDNFENFDARGLKRSGDLVLRLAERFDAGVPGRTTERYWLMLAWGVPFFIPLWALWLFGAAAVAVAAAALFRLRAGRLRKGDPGYGRWSVAKVWIALLVIVAAGWCSSDLIGVMRGIRHPWFTSIGLYTLFGSLAAALAAWLAVRFSRFRITACPYPLYRGAAIVLLFLTALGAAVSAKLVVEPAAGLFLLGAAFLARPAALRAALLALSPLWLLRLVFSEWAGMLFRLSGLSLPPTATATIIADLLMVVLLGLLLLPFCLGVLALVRDSAPFRRAAEAAMRPAVFAGAGALFLLLGALLMTLPAYNRFWYRNVSVTQRHAMDGTGTTIEVRSSEFLDGMRLRRAGVDSTIEGRTAILQLEPKAFDSTWVRVERSGTAEPEGDGRRFKTELRIACAFRPLTVAVRYTGPREGMLPVMSPWMSSSVRGAEVLQWEHYPDSLLTIPVEFVAIGGDSVVETIEVTFDRLADPIDIQHEMSYVIPRTTFVATHIYR